MMTDFKGVELKLRLPPLTNDGGNDGGNNGHGRAGKLVGCFIEVWRQD